MHFIFCLACECIKICIGIKSKVKCTFVQALMLCTGRTAHKGSRDIALLLLDHDTRRGWGISVTPRPLFTPGKDPVPIVQEAGGGGIPGSVWTGAEYLAPTGIRSRTIEPVASGYTDWATRPLNAVHEYIKTHFLVISEARPTIW